MEIHILTEKDLSGPFDVEHLSIETQQNVDTGEYVVTLIGDDEPILHTCGIETLETAKIVYKAMLDGLGHDHSEWVFDEENSVIPDPYHDV